MNTFLGIGIYMIAASLTMIGYVWIKSVKHSRSGYDQMLETESFAEEDHTTGEILAA
ncbi:MAG: hypothetical protein ABIO55_15140 [Ginsengibacter sp.]